MRLVYEAIEPVNPVTTIALASLFALCALIVAIGIIKLVDAFSRALFGTLSGTVGWIPFAGRLVKRDLHKIEQKISNGLGSAERKLDAGVAWTWNNCAHLVAYVGTEIEGLAKGSWHIAQQLKGFVTPARLDHVVKANVRPANAKAAQAARAAHNAQVGASMVGSYIATGVTPRLKSAEWEIDHVLEPGLEAVRARTKALENGAIRTFEWINAHRRGVAAGVFTAAVAWALSRLGGGWIRCANWRNLGKRVCGMNNLLLDALLLDTLILLSPISIVKFAEELLKVEDEIIAGVKAGFVELRDIQV